MKMKITLIVGLFFFSSFCIGQNISENHFASKYTYVFQLDSSQVRKAYQGIRLDSSMYLRHKIDSFMSDSAYRHDMLPAGLYYFVKVQGAVVSYTSFYKQPFKYELWGINDRNFITLKDLDNHIIHDGRITLVSGLNCAFVKGMGAYEIPKSKVPVMLKMTYNGQWDYVMVNPQYIAAPKMTKSYPNYRYTTIAPGYLVFSQPRFKYYDTLKFKAFLLNDNGTAMKQRLKMYLGVDGKEKFIGYLKPQTPGAYFGEFEISDTMLMDKDYSLSFRNTSNEIVKSSTFFIENYELKPNKYVLKGPKQKCLVGDEVSLTVAVLDANNLPVMDASISVDLKVSQIRRYLKDRLFIPDIWFHKSYYHIESSADASGYTTLTIPDSLFKYFDAEYEIVVHIKDPDQNIRELKSTFSYENQLYAYDMQYRADSLNIKAFFKTKSIPQDFTLETVYQNKIKKQLITAPYSQAVDFYAQTYRLYLKDSLILTYTAPANYPSMVYFKGKRSGDSIHIELVNPIGLPVYYELYRHKNKIDEGYGSSVDYHAKDITDQSYHVVWGYNYQGEFKNSLRVQSFHLYEASLNVQIKQASEIYPGQKVDISIQVTDQFNRGVSGVNLAAYAVNMQFEQIPFPEVPYMGLTRGVYPLRTLQPMSYLPNINYSVTLKKYHFQLLGLFSNEMYVLLYGKGGKNMVIMPTKRKSPELSAYVYKNHQLQNIVYIKIDHQLVFHQYHLSPSAFSFQVPEGKHTITVRTFDRLLTYTNLQLKDSTKHVIAFNLDSIKYQADTNLYLTGKLKRYEQDEFLNHTLLLSLRTAFDTFSIEQHHQIKVISNQYNYNSSLSFIRIENDKYFALGPLEQATVSLQVNRQYEHDFEFQRGKAYLAYTNEIKEIPVRDALRYYSFVANTITNSGIYNLTSFNVLSYAPEYDTLVKPIISGKDESAEIKPKRSRPTVEQRQFIPQNTKDYQKGHIVFVGVHEELYRHAWLINRDNHQMSVVNMLQRNEQYYYEQGHYDLLLFTDSSFSIYRNLYLKTSGTFVLFVKPEHFNPFDLSKIYPFESIVSELTKEPFRTFSDTPLTIEPIKVIDKIYNPGMAKLSGVVADARFNTPIDYTQIYLEIDGYFKAGAMSNSEGKFEINALPAGNYMLKIRVANYRYQVIYNLRLEKGKELVIRLNLIHREDDVHYDSSGALVIDENSENNNVSYEWNYGDLRESEQVTLANSVHRNIDAMHWNAAGVSNTVTLSGRGASDASSVYYVDGVRMNKTGVAEENNQVFMDRDYLPISEQGMGEKLEAMAQISQANRIRDHFRDYAYWVPNLLTDANGMAYITVTFPDNITSWQTMVPAMNGKRQSGMGQMVTRSFKPVSALMSVPFFLVEGDKIILRGRTSNYTGKAQDIRLRFLLNDSVIKSRDARVEKFLLDSMTVRVPKGIDSIQGTFVFDMKNGYSDGEEKTIPVKPNGILISQSQQILLKTDTTIRIGIPLDVKSAKIMLHNSEIERLMTEIDALKNYQYGCVEQTTSKLRALLAEKTLKTSLGLPFKEDKMVRKLIHNLDKLKNDEGTWSWWGGYGEEDWLSSYVMRTLNQARLAGYSNNVYIRAAKRMEKRLPLMSLEARLYALNTLLDMDRNVQYDSFVKGINQHDLTDNQQVLYLRILQKTGNKYQISDVTKLLRYHADGGIYFGENTWNFQNDLSSTTLLAYDILSHNDTGSEYLPYIREFFYSSAYPRHTFALAEMIAMGTEEVIRKKKANLKIVGDVQINGYSLQAADYPFSKRLKPGDTVSITHKGPAAYATIVGAKLESQPQPDHTYFSIHTSLSGQNAQIRLNAGEPVEMLVNVTVYKNSEHVMLEIPLPAGFSYHEKPKASGIETNREYYVDKTSIFCRNLPAGNYTFRIMLWPKFSGEFNLPPAKIELMYYPEIHNNESLKMILVE